MIRRGAVPTYALWIALAVMAFGIGVFVVSRSWPGNGTPSTTDGGGSQPGPGAGDDCSGFGDKSCPAGFECVQRCGPPVAREDDPPPGWYCEVIGKPRICPICLASDVIIDAPSGGVDVKEARKGMIVWTLDSSGEKVAGEILEVSRAEAPASHRVVRLILSDGREARVSPGHPTIDGRRVGDLRAGDDYDGAIVRSAELEPYGGDATYDILPEGIGVYWANGILLGSTLQPYR